MSLRQLPEIRAGRPPACLAFEPDPAALERWPSDMRAAEEQAPTNTISILDVIGEDFWTGGGVTSKRVAAALRSIGDREVFVDINSPGGDFFEGVAIYNQLRAHPNKVTVRVLSLAASAASIIAMAGDDIQVGKAGFVMVHNVWSRVVGNRHDLADAIGTLREFDESMASVYAARAGVEKADATAWMDKETWFNGEKAVEAGLADGFLPADATRRDGSSTRADMTLRRADALLAKAGMPRGDRRELFGNLRGTQDAARNGTRDAADIGALIQGMRNTLKSMRT